MINCETGAEARVAEDVKSIDYVKEVLGVFGNYDVVVKLECPTIEEVSNTISKKIRNLDKVNCTTTLMCANWYQSIWNNVPWTYSTDFSNVYVIDFFKPIVILITNYIVWVDILVRVYFYFMLEFFE